MPGQRDAFPLKEWKKDGVAEARTRRSLEEIFCDDIEEWRVSLVVETAGSWVRLRK